MFPDHIWGITQYFWTDDEATHAYLYYNVIITFCVGHVSADGFIVSITDYLAEVWLCNNETRFLCYVSWTCELQQLLQVLLRLRGSPCHRTNDRSVRRSSPADKLLLSLCHARIELSMQWKQIHFKSATTLPTMHLNVQSENLTVYCR